MSIVLNSKTYNFDGYDRNGVSTFTERSGGTPTSFSVLTFGSENGKDVTKLTARLSVPIVGTVDPTAGEVIRTSRVTMTFEEPNTGLAAERTDWAARITALAANAQFVAFLSNLVKPST